MLQFRDFGSAARVGFVAIGVSVGSVAAIEPARADLVLVDLGRTAQYTQTDAAGSTSLTGFFFSGRAFYGNAGDFDQGTLTYPGPDSPATLTNVPGATTNPVSAGFLTKQTPFFANQAALDSAFPTGRYTFSVSNSGTSATGGASVNYDKDAYSNIPVLTSTSFNALQGANAASDLAVGFNTMTPSADADQAFVFFTIFDTAFNVAFSSGFLDPTVGSVLVPANTLAPGTSYIVDITFSDRISGTDSTDPNNPIDANLLFDQRTEVGFRTAAVETVPVPEPATLALLGFGLIGLAAVRRRG